MTEDQSLPEWETDWIRADPFSRIKPKIVVDDASGLGYSISTLKEIDMNTLNRAYRLYLSYKTTSFEYKQIAASLGVTSLELNRRMHDRMRAEGRL